MSKQTQLIDHFLEKFNNNFVCNENDYQVDSKFTIDSVIWQLSHMVQVLNEPEKKAEMPV